ncbi:hypothetical protein [uncultured Alistipes sp.]|uniref:hypothetical protein n=1 Tax=uncultured Alistipes sp. TaxID=538949 RepID=UPI00280636C1|nr:hypothetical protein [uncultured Alistipes sp.]
MKNFDYAAAERGATVCTAEGQAVRILCYDLKHKLYPIVAAIMDSDGTEWLHRYTIKGTFTGDVDINYDLMMADDDYLEKLERGEYDKPVRKNNGACVTEVECTVLKTESPYDDDYWRRMYAGMAMQAFITSDPQELTLSHAESAVVAADALIEKLKKQPDPKI